jgi:hypothetical protein
MGSSKSALRPLRLRVHAFFLRLWRSGEWGRGCRGRTRPGGKESDGRSFQEGISLQKDKNRPGDGRFLKADFRERWTPKKSANVTSVGSAVSVSARLRITCESVLSSHAAETGFVSCVGLGTRGPGSEPGLGSGGLLHQERLAGALDFPSDLPVVMRRHPGEATPQDFAVLGHESAEQIRVFPVDRLEGDIDAPPGHGTIGSAEGGTAFGCLRLHTSG